MLWSVACDYGLLVSPPCVFAFLIATGLFAFPWYLRNLIRTGNPLYSQNLAGLFPVNPMNAEYLQLAHDAIRLPTPFATAAATCCPLLILGIWGRRLSTIGAAAGLVVGGTLATTAVLLTIFKQVHTGWAGALLTQPAAWTLPTTFVVMMLVSLMTPARIPKGTARTMVRLHAPELSG